MTATSGTAKWRFSRTERSEILDPERHFTVEAVVQRRPPDWPEDIEADLKERRAENDLAPPFAASSVWVDPSGLLWVRSVMPEEDFHRDIRVVPNSERGRDYVTTDRGWDTLLEAIDLSRREVVLSYRLDEGATWILGPGMLGSYAGDLPYPRIEVFEIPFDEESR